MEDTFSKLKVEDITTANQAMARCLRLAGMAAKSDVQVLLLGETGTGKTLMARAIHNSSSRAAAPFISFNASAMSDSLLESQLFGHERGAFTGAQQMVKGKFELADGGTLFLDEVADMSPLAQVKILRVLEYGEFERLGSERMSKCDVRVISAANCSLQSRIRQGKFREDLYHRLAGLSLLIPPLRERREELPVLIAGELKSQARVFRKNIMAIHPESMDKLLSHQWRGNLRELSHVVRTMVLFCEGNVVLPDHVFFPEDLSSDLNELPAASEPRPADPPPSAADDLTLSAAALRHIRFVHQQAQGNQRRTAKLLGISRATLARHLKNGHGGK
jgi:two-component system response regulator HydG